IKVLSPDSLRSFGLAGLRAAFVNLGTNDASGLQLKIQFDRLVVVSSFTVIGDEPVQCEDPVGAGGLSSISCSMATMSVRKPVTIYIVARMGDLGSSPNVSFTATASSTSPQDPDLTNNSHS